MSTRRTFTSATTTIATDIYKGGIVSTRAATGPTNWIWEDSHLLEICKKKRGTIGVEGLIELGECMMIMSTVGPFIHLGDVVAALASHLRDPVTLEDAFHNLQEETVDGEKTLSSVLISDKISEIKRVCRHSCYDLFGNSTLPVSFLEEAQMYSEDLELAKHEKLGKDLEEYSDEEEGKAGDEDDTHSVISESLFSGPPGGAELKQISKLVELERKATETSHPGKDEKNAKIQEQENDNNHPNEIDNPTPEDETDKKGRRQKNRQSRNVKNERNKRKRYKRSELANYMEDIEAELIKCEQNHDNTKKQLIEEVKAVYLHGAKVDNYLLIYSILNTIRKWPKGLQIAFYTFSSAVLVRSGVKSLDAVNANWVKSKERFLKFYNSQDLPYTYPDIEQMAYDTMKTSFEPGRDHLKMILKYYLQLRHSPDISVPMRGILDYTVLIQFSYNGMGMIALTAALCAYWENDDAREVLLTFECSGTKNSIAAIIGFLTTYGSENKHGQGLYAPWSRALDNNYWSKLSPKNHKLLATGLVTFLSDTQSSIWSMVGLKYDPDARSLFEELKRLKASQEVQEQLGGARSDRSILKKFSKEVKARINQRHGPEVKDIDQGLENDKNLEGYSSDNEGSVTPSMFSN